MEFKIQSAQGFFSIFNPQMKHVTQKYNSQWFTNVLSYRKRMNFQATVKSIKRKAGGDTIWMHDATLRNFKHCYENVHLLWII